jgi:hypothetical protein
VQRSSRRPNWRGTDALFEHERCRSRDDHARAAGILVRVYTVLIAMAGLIRCGAESTDISLVRLVMIVMMVMMRVRLSAVIMSVNDGAGKCCRGRGEAHAESWRHGEHNRQRPHEDAASLSMLSKAVDHQSEYSTHADLGFCGVIQQA